MADARNDVTINMIGAYGPWAASLAGEGPARFPVSLSIAAIQHNRKPVRRADLGPVYKVAKRRQRLSAAM